MKVLMPSVGDKTYLCRRLRAALRERGGSLLGADLDGGAPALRHVDARVELAPFGDPAYWSSVTRAIDREGIGAVIPVRDAELAAWAERAEAGLLRARVFLSSAETLAVCHDKVRLYRHAATLGVRCPDWYLPGDDPPAEGMRFPVVLKPRLGSGSRGVSLVHDRAALDKSGIDPASGYLVQRHVEGREYSVDCFASSDGALTQCCARERSVVERGQSVAGVPAHRPDLAGHCRTLAATLAFRGVVNFQFVCNRHGSWLIDVNPRFPGGIAITEAAGFAYCDRTVQALMA